MSDKQLVLETLARLPESATLKEIREELRILAGIKRGQADAEAGRVTSHCEVERLVAGWTSK